MSHVIVNLQDTKLSFVWPSAVRWTLEPEQNDTVYPLRVWYPGNNFPVTLARLTSYQSRLYVGHSAYVNSDFLLNETLLPRTSPAVPMDSGNLVEISNNRYLNLITDRNVLTRLLIGELIPISELQDVGTSIPEVFAGLSAWEKKHDRNALSPLAAAVYWRIVNMTGQEHENS